MPRAQPTEVVASRPYNPNRAPIEHIHEMRRLRERGRSFAAIREELRKAFGRAYAQRTIRRWCHTHYDNIPKDDLIPGTDTLIRSARADAPLLVPDAKTKRHAATDPTAARNSLKLRYAAFMCIPKAIRSSREDFAKANGIVAEKLKKWERTKSFKELIEQIRDNESDALLSDAIRSMRAEVAEVAEAVTREAKKGNTKAQELYYRLAFDWAPAQRQDIELSHKEDPEVEEAMRLVLESLPAPVPPTNGEG